MRLSLGTQMPSAYAELGETCAARPLETPSGLGLSPSGNPTLSRGRIPTPPPDGVGYAATTFRPVAFIYETLVTTEEQGGEHER